jgi:hypothetical protein
MPISINGTGTITGLSAGGLPDDSIVTADIANSAVTTAKVNDSAITPAKLSGGQSGSAPAYAARAWVNFNGTGTVAIRASGNVSSITDNGSGDYTLNFTTTLPDVDYSLVGSTECKTAFNVVKVFQSNTGALVTPTTSAARITTGNNTTNQDVDYVCVAVLR